MHVILILVLRASIEATVTPSDAVFQPPVPIINYTEDVYASTEGPACPLPAPPLYYIDEDCLRINVYTPTLQSSRKLPVIFYIHPGGFYAFTGRSDVIGPHYMLDRDVVLVSINYRLGTLGWMATGDRKAPGNNGMKDQVVALQWVQRNIAAFGGNPDLVTIAGCSAGSISVMLHMISPMTQGLFHRAISMSAGPIGASPTPIHQRHLAVRQGELLNCTQDLYDCLMTASWRAMGNSLNGFYEFGFDPVGLWKPVVEPDFGQQRYLDIEPTEAIVKGRMHAVPHMISQTRDEFFWKAFTVLNNQTLIDKMNDNWDQVAPISFQLPKKDSTEKVRRLLTAYLGDKKIENTTESAKALGKLYSDAIIGFTAHRMANLMAQHSPHPVYNYLFSYVGDNSHYEDPVTKQPKGAAHHDDEIYLFSKSYRFPTIPPTSPHSFMVDRMTAIFYNFARYGDPNSRGDTPELGSVYWQPMKPNDRKFLDIDKELKVGTDLFEDRYKVWEELYPLPILTHTYQDRH